MKSKKLSKVEIDVISSEVGKRVNEMNVKVIEKKLIKDKNYLELKKLFIEREKLNVRSREINNGINFGINSIRDKYKVYVNYINNEVNVVNNNVYSNYYNDIVLMNIDSENNIDELINKVVEKYLIK
jgi:hypothetical protein